MAILRIMVGIPGSGKSTYAKEIQRDYQNWVVNSSDAIREELYGNEDDQSHNNEIFNTMLRRTVAALYAGMNCIYDATNLSAKRRANLIKEICRQVKDVHYEAVVMATPIDNCLVRNAARERSVPTYVIFSMLKRFEMPALWEGFDEIKVYGNDKPDGVLNANELMHIAERMEQNNPHHTLTVGHHMQKAYTLYMTQFFDANYWIAQAILWHDIGKIYCKTFTNMCGEPTDIAHFYGHANVSAYIYLSLLAVANINGTLRGGDELIVNLIQHHMDFFNDEKYLEKVRERYGDEFMKQLAIVHTYDIAAH